MDSAREIELMQRVRQGDEGALREIIEHHRGYLYRLAYRLLGDGDDASDAVQETFIRLWRHARRYDSRQSLRTWLGTICVRRCYDELRRRQRHRRALTELPSESLGAEPTTAEELLVELHRVVAELPAKQRVVYQLREIECLTADEVARMTRMSSEQVKANLYVARNTVREKMKRYGV